MIPDHTIFVRTDKHTVCPKNHHDLPKTGPFACGKPDFLKTRPMAKSRLKTKALSYSTYGDPSEVLSCVEIPVPALQSDEALVRLLFAVINPSDLGMIQGRYGRLQDLPTVAGREGVGEVVEVGSEVTGLRPGDRVRFPEEQGTWRELAVISASDALIVPKEIDPRQAAMAFINPPTAVRLLEDFVELMPDQWIIQNAANSAVGLSVIDLARHRGFNTINVVRREELAEPLIQRGATRVVLESEAYEKTIGKDQQVGAVNLGLNSIGGESVVKLIRTVSDGATIVTFGGMVGDPVRFPTRQLIFNDLHLCGFWLDRWKRSVTSARSRELQREVFELMAEGLFQLPVADVYPLHQFADALRHQAEPRLGKILLQAA